MSRRDLVIDAIEQRRVERVPVGFWFHFADESDFSNGLVDSSVIETNINGHQKYFDEFKPDFLKLMSDGFFGYPSKIIEEAAYAEDLWKVKAVGENHPWIQKQVKLVLELTKRFGTEVVTFYNIFSPLTFFQIIREGKGQKTPAEFFREDPKAFAYALEEISKDLQILVKKIITEAKVDGIYLSVKNIQDPCITVDEYKTFVAPSEHAILAVANEASKHHILHICGYENARNNLLTYVDYNATIINWAVHVEHISLAEGKKIFQGKTVLGGFPNSKGSLIETGSKEELEQLTVDIIKNTGNTGLLIGADCTVPSSISLERLSWIREKAYETSI